MGSDKSLSDADHSFFSNFFFKAFVKTWQKQLFFAAKSITNEKLRLKAMFRTALTVWALIFDSRFLSNLPLKIICFQYMNMNSWSSSRLCLVTLILIILFKFWFSKWILPAVCWSYQLQWPLFVQNWFQTFSFVLLKLNITKILFDLVWLVTYFD